MIEETKDDHISLETSLVPISEVSLEEARANLSSESQKLISELTLEKDRQKMQAIEQQFNDIQRKKQLARVSKLSDVQDMLTDQFYQRIAQRPDEISNKEMLDGMKVIQDLMEKNQKRAEAATEEVPQQLIQINQTEVNVGNNLNRDSREKVKNAVISILDSINKAQQPSTGTDFVDADIIAEEDDSNG
jgi:hypothetical protein